MVVVVSIVAVMGETLDSKDHPSSVVLVGSSSGFLTIFKGAGTRRWEKRSFLTRNNTTRVARLALF